MSRSSLSSAPIAGGSSTNKPAATCHSLMNDVRLDGYQISTDSCQCRSHGCSCKACICTSSNHQRNNSNRNVYRSQGGEPLRGLTAGIGALNVQDASYSSLWSLSSNNSFNEQAAPSPTALQGNMDLDHTPGSSHRHETLARLRQFATQQFVEGSEEHPWDAAPWEQFLTPELTREVPEDISSMAFAMQDSMHVSVDLSNQERSMLSSHASSLERHSVSGSELLYGIGGMISAHVFEGQGRLRPPSNFIVLCPECRHAN